jgi:hypothetical protein
MRIKRTGEIIDARMRVHQLVESAYRDVELAAIYISDGAWHSGANCLRVAADKLDRAQTRKTKLIQEATKKVTT